MRDFLLRLYPAAWRTRYGDEFEALLEERPLGPFDVADVLLGAVDAHVHRRGQAGSQNRKGRTMSRHLGGTAAVIGSCLLIVSQFLRHLSELHGEFVILAGMIALVVAMAGLSALQSRRHPIVTWVAFGVAAAGMLVWPIFGIAGYFVAQPIGELWAVTRLIGFLALTGGSAMFGALTYRTASVSRPASALLALSGTFLFVGILSAFLGAYVEAIGGLALLYGFGYLLFPVSWIALGLSAVRLDRRSALAAA